MSPKYTNEPIAVIGSGCRFPGDATNASKLWDLLSQPRDVLRKIDRFRADNWHNEDGHHHGASNVLDAYLLEEDPRAFDSQFFSIQGGEADSIDPQQRVLMETVYEAMEKAGLSLEEMQGSPTAVFVGVMCDDYSDVIYNDSEQVPKYAATGSSRAILSNRVSYFFNWTGPSMTIDTACSSSLVAVHQALQVLRSGESRLAVAAGSNLIFGPKMFIAESNLNMLSATGRSQMWDDNANGYARGEGVASVILKKLSDAIADGDNIECIIRETGVNQDGRTPGITMPSWKAQAQLIRDTYARAGLDPTKASDRCQYFEAHGTGTKAGDPQEARAIYTAFFGDSENKDPNDILHVGSIKTIIGHTEGTAGIAGLMKASLAVQNKLIPPNMLFKELNPDIAPFWDHLRIPTAGTEWPTLPEGGVRRVSVNSFGFGGTNAHAIVEAYEPEVAEVEKASPTNDVVIPFTFAATSEKALATQLQTHLDYLIANKDIDMRSLAWTLSKRSAFNYRASFSATSAEGLCAKINDALEAKKGGANIGTKPSNKGEGILGVFTGQGAQWPAMARELILGSKYVEDIVDQLEESLATLPESDRPTWSLKKEILALAPESRVAESLFSQPLCTVVQVILVELLKKAGIKFAAVVGHSSGEIGAAYACGLINARDAIRIAYYRGFHAKLAKGPNGEQGSMLAAGTSMEDAQELCELEDFEGRLKVAASNSSASVTISGDFDAITQAKEIFEDEGTFARQLKVETAYHSHHMLPCSESYITSLRDCKIDIQTPPEGSAQWYSSVIPGQKMGVEHAVELGGTYWNDNMVNPVLFSQALTAALEDNELPAMALEVGPHPALKGPASLVIEEALGSGLPYSGVLSRGKNDVESFADGLGFTWVNLGPQVVRLAALDKVFAKDPESTPRLMKEIPGYVWDHDRVHWFESRASRAQRLRTEKPHELLGTRESSESEKEYRWRNYIKLSEIPWLQGHAIQGQVLFPAAGFAVMAIEASRTLAAGSEISLIELLDFSIHRAMSVPDDIVGVETLFSLSDVEEQKAGGNRSVTANFTCSTSVSKDSTAFKSVAYGSLIVHLNEPSADVLPARKPNQMHLRDVDVTEFYNDLANIGYNYSELFYGISELKRSTATSSGIINIPAEPEYQCPFTIHPATLDVAFQALFAAIGSPGDGALWTLHVPTMIDKIQINPLICPAGGAISVELPFDAHLTRPESYEVSGDIELFDRRGYNIVQIQGLHVSPLSTPTKKDDKTMFGKNTWGVATPNMELVYRAPATEATVDKDLADDTARTCLFYLNRLVNSVPEADLAKCDAHQTAVMNWATKTIAQVSQDAHPTLKKDWLNDSQSQIESLSETNADLGKLSFIGERLIPFVKGELSLVDDLKAESLQSWLKNSIEGAAHTNSNIAALVKQVSHLHPYMRILEIGAGSGETTKAILDTLGQSYGSYTFTDVSEDLFEEAQERFAEHSKQFVYTALDINQDPVEQGFVANTYDMVIASNVLHPTASLDDTLKNVRKLTKPGGYLVFSEVTQQDPVQLAFRNVGSPEFWTRAEGDTRAEYPTVSKNTWAELLQHNGFSGIDTASPEGQTFSSPSTIILSQAVDNQMNFYREPLKEENQKTVIDNLLVVGGKQISTYKLATGIRKLLKPYAEEVDTIEKLEDVLQVEDLSKYTVLVLSELDENVFNPFTPEKYQALQRLSEEASNILWIIQGSRGDNPFSNMVPAVARCFYVERAHLRLQFLDFDVKKKLDPKYITETLLRLKIQDSWSTLRTPYAPLCPFEREIFVVDGTVEVPRYKADEELDEHFNANHRLIRRPLSLENTSLRVNYSGSAYELSENRKCIFGEKTVNKDQVTVHVTKSMLTSVKVKGVGHVYLVLGKDDSGKKVFGFSAANQSTITTPRTWVVSCNVADADEGSFLLTAANGFLADAVLSKAAKTQSRKVLVHEPTELLSKVLTQRGADLKVAVAMTSSKSGLADLQYIHPSTSDRMLQASLPKNVAAYVNLSTDTSAHNLGARIEQLLPASCKRYNSAMFIEEQSNTSTEVANEAVLKSVSDCATRTLNFLKSEKVDAKEITVSELPGQAKRQELNVLSWEAGSVVEAKVNPFEDDCTFRSDRTYFLVGLTGELGQSLTTWMVDRGARYIALSSRKPELDPHWLATLEAKGATVKGYAMDVTSRMSVMQAYEKITEEMPEICGVANGAMILIDGLFVTMPYSDFSRVIKPKVDGTLYLDEIFSENTLDFFILFSSLTFITGNIGQTPYAAGNAFLVSMAEGRRKRGLAGSVMNLAGIAGIGYINRTDKSIHDRLGNMGYATIGEWDFLQFFAEAVFSGHPESGRNFEVSTALKSFDPERDTNLPEWIDVPKFANYKVMRNTDTGKNGAGNVSLKEQLKDQTTAEGVQQVLVSGIIANLYRQLNIPPEENSITPDSSLVELGIDSLVAIDLRTWLATELGVDIPVVKLLGGATIESLAEDSMQRLSPDLVPNLGKADGEESKPEEKPAEGEAKEDPKPEAEAEIDSDSQSGEESVAPEEVPVETETPLSSNVSEIDEEVEEVVNNQVVKFDKKVQMGYGAANFWFATKLLDDPNLFNLEFRIVMHTNVNVPRMEKAIDTIGKRHEAFRTCFFADPDNNGQPTQGVMPTSRLRLEKLNAKDQDDVRKISENVLKHVYDIEKGDVAKAILVTVNPTLHYMIFGFSHLAIDGFSYNLFLQELIGLYEGHELPPVQMQYSDFALRQRQEVEAGLMAKEIAFWKKEFQKVPEPLPLFPVAQVSSRRTMKTYEYDEPEEVCLDQTLLNRISDLCRRNKSTRFHFFLAVLRIFLFRYLDMEDACIGIADANRLDTKLNNTVGYLINLLPLKFEKNSTQKFSEALKEARDKSYNALSHSKIPWDVLLENLQVPRSSSHNPLFQAFLGYRKITAAGLGGATDDGVSHPGQTAYDVTFDMSEVQNQEVRINCRTQKYLYPKKSAEVLLKSYVRLVKAFAANGELRAHAAPLFDMDDTKRAIEFGRGASLSVGTPQTVSQRLDEVIKANPHAVSLKDGEGNSLTYKQMQQRVDAIGASLVDAGVGAGSLVGVFQEPTADWVCSLLAIWKVGAAFVPLYPRNPTERLSMIVEGSKAKAIIYNNGTSDRVSELSADAVKLVNVSQIAKVGKPLENKSKPGSPAMVLYTSGSTGVPKGCILSHSAILNEIVGHIEKHNIGKENVLQQSAYSFDLSLWQVCMGLFNGGSVYVVDKDTRVDAVEITKLVGSQNITVTMATPSEYLNWLRYGKENLAAAKDFYHMAALGEPVNHDLIRELKTLGRTDVKFFNTYGPAEATIAATTTEIDYMSIPDDSEEPISIGTPLPNYAVYIVDSNLKTVPAGVAGEMVIGGASVGLGYLGNDELTKDRFIPDHYTPAGVFPFEWSKVYRTGDLARMQPDGSFVHLGRIPGDSQVKLHGIRTELGDVESTIVKASNGQVFRAVASIRGGILVAHVELAPGIPDHATFLRSLTASLPLPQYMIPTMIIPVDKVPYNSHGKIDRRAVASLPLPQDKSSEEDTNLTETEQGLKELWKSVIPAELAQSVSINASSSFFDVGGDSLLIVRLQSLIRERFDIMLPLLEIFEVKSLRSMAAKIDKAASADSLNWDSEVALIAPKPYDMTYATELRSGSNLRVLLTGPTGYLGKRILKQLVDDEKVSTVYCVGVREKNGQKPSERLTVESSKIILYPGDLKAKRLGLSQEDFTKLSNEVDIILHSGANRDFWEFYQALRGSNVSSTKELVEMAAPRKVPFHFVSSNGILRLDGSNGDDQEPISMAKYQPPSDGTMGYVATKWVSEVYLENAAKFLGLPVSVHRVTAPPANAEPEDEMLKDISELIKRMRKLPDTNAWNGKFDLISTPRIVKRITDATLNQHTWVSHKPSYIHYPSEVRMSMQQVKSDLKLNDESITDYELLLPHVWVGAAKRAGLEYHFSSQDLEIGNGKGTGHLSLRR